MFPTEGIDFNRRGASLSSPFADGEWNHPRNDENDHQTDRIIRYIYQKDDDTTNPINHLITTILFFLLRYKI